MVRRGMGRPNKRQARWDTWRQKVFLYKVCTVFRTVCTSVDGKNTMGHGELTKLVDSTQNVPSKS